MKKLVKFEFSIYDINHDITSLAHVVLMYRFWKFALNF